jgi:hypothetical protein
MLIIFQAKTKFWFLIHAIERHTAPQAIKRLQCQRDFRKFNAMKTFVPTFGFRHLRRSWMIIPGWVAS